MKSRKLLFIVKINETKEKSMNFNHVSYEISIVLYELLSIAKNGMKSQPNKVSTWFGDKTAITVELDEFVDISCIFIP